MKQYTLCELTRWELQAVFDLLKRTPEFMNEYPSEMFAQALATGMIQLWAEPDALTPVAVMVTEIQRTAEGKRVTILSFAGTNVDDQRVMFSSIKNWAAKNGASRIRAICKDPQTRLFARDGFVKIANVIELELDHDE